MRPGCQGVATPYNDALGGVLLKVCGECRSFALTVHPVSMFASPGQII